MSAENNYEDYDMLSHDMLSIEDVGLVIGQEGDPESSVEQAEAGSSLETREPLQAETDPDASLPQDAISTAEFADDAVQPTQDEPVVEDGLDSAGEAVDPVDFGLDRIVQRLDQLSREFESKIKYDTHKEKIIDSLHQELQQYKDDIVKKHLLSVLMDVIKIIDDIRKWLNHYSHQEEAARDPLKLVQYLESIPSDLEDLFYWQGVKPFTCSDGAFDPARQRITKKIETPDKSRDKTVAESLRVGYEWEGKVIRPEMVAIYSYKEASAAQETRSSHE